MKQRTETRKIADQIKKITGKSLLFINFKAQQYVSSGLCANRKEALKYMLLIETLQ